VNYGVELLLEYAPQSTGRQVRDKACKNIAAKMSMTTRSSINVNPEERA